jgi:lysophospholipase L1-like esterase
VSLARRLGSAVLFAVVLLVTGEAASRALHLADRLNGFPRRIFTATDDPDLPYVLTPGTDITMRGMLVRVNDLGLRGPRTSAEPAPGVHRVLALGDSVAFGEGLQAEEAIPALLERELGERTGERWEVLNAGVEGYNTEAELGFLRRRGLALRPETVVVVFNLNDYDWAPVLGPLGILTRDPAARVPVRSLANVSELWFVLRWLVDAKGRPWETGKVAAADLTPAPGERFSRFDRYISALRKNYWKHPEDACWPTLVGSLRGLGEVARANRLRLVIAIVPDGDQIGVPDLDLTPQTKLRALCAEAHLDCLDLQPIFAAAPDRELFFDTMHPNAAGHRLLAHAVADHLLAGKRG